MDHAATLELTLQSLEVLLEAGELDAAETHLREAVHSFGDEQPDLHYYGGTIAFERGDFAGARAAFSSAVGLDPRFGDAHHALGLLCEMTGEREASSEHFMAVWRLDSEADLEDGRLGRALEERIAERADAVVSKIPARFRDHLVNVPIVIEERPAEDLVRAGFDPRALGLFEGLEAAAQQTDLAMAPSRIVLYSANLAAAFPEAADLDEQIEITLLHEIGHFFGLDEDGVEALGLG